MVDPVRQVARSLAGARDGQIAEVVSLVDAMQARGQADALIAPLRGRLRALRPARRPRFGRLLFAPLDPVIVPAADWRAETATVPRTALAPIEAIVRRQLGTEAAVIETALCEDGARIGERLWAAAAAALRDGGDVPPPMWSEAGLAAAAFPPLRRAIASVLAVAERIDAWTEQRMDDLPSRPPPEATELRAMLATALTNGAEACALVGAVLLARMPRACGDVLDAIAAIGEGNSASARRCAELALDATLGRIETATTVEIGSVPLGDAAREIQGAALLMEGIGRGAGPRRRECLDTARQAVSRACRSRFETALAENFIAPLTTLSGGSGSIAPAELEAVARDLRRFETAARKLGGSAAYDEALRRAADLTGGLAADAPLTRADRIRLAEILAGPERALRLFGLG